MWTFGALVEIGDWIMTGYGFSPDDDDDTCFLKNKKTEEKLTQVPPFGHMYHNICHNYHFWVYHDTFLGLGWML